MHCLRGHPPPPNKSAVAAAGVVVVVRPTVVGRPQTQETETSFLRVSSSPSETISENQQHNPPENWKEQHLIDEEKTTTPQHI